MIQGPKLDSLLPPLSPEDVAGMDDELTRLRRLMERGESAGLAGGPILLWWGGVLGIGHLCMSLAYAGLLPALPYGLLYFVAGLIGTVVIAVRVRRHSLLSNWRTEAVSAAWLFAGAGIFVYSVGSFVAGVYSPVSNMAFLAVVFALISAVTGAACRRDWMIIPSAGWLLMSGLTFLFDDNHALRTLAFSLSAFVLMAVPGWALTDLARQARQVKQALGLRLTGS
ncbi:hypothetical protein [Asticcacaulis sp. AND118]|uniref:hypothetical protein n=1 Tax=Asticcacaulis sp. AND118 TaxID=2840468 RepID=UPI001D0019F0|nr:hypothetical protein [Asticcacaulis sp. AND118]UDF03938.1 hypothetical protein LH365_02535 [Asticcacaulis sp. AND118]